MKKLLIVLIAITTVIIITYTTNLHSAIQQAFQIAVQKTPLKVSMVQDASNLDTVQSGIVATGTYLYTETGFKLLRGDDINGAFVNVKAMAIANQTPSDNKTTPSDTIHVNSFPQLYNGTTWDMERHSWNNISCNNTNIIGPCTTIDISKHPMTKHTVTIYNPLNLILYGNVNFEGSIDGINWFTINEFNLSNETFLVSKIDYGTFYYRGNIKTDIWGHAKLNVGENAPLYTAVIDESAGFAYFSTADIPSKIIKIRLSDFTVVDKLTLNSEESYPWSAVIDTVNKFAYFGSYYTSPGRIVKIRLSDFTKVATLTLDAGEVNLRSAVIDTVNGYAYFGTYTAPGKIVKIRLSDFTKVATLTLDAGEDFLATAVIDTTNGYAYFGTYTAPGKIVKIRLSDFTKVATLTLDVGEDYLTTAVIDTVNGYAYFGTWTSPGKIIKIRLSDFSKVDTITNLIQLMSAVINIQRGFAYFGTEQYNYNCIYKIDLVNFKVSDYYCFDSDPLYCAVIDTINNFSYWGTDLNSNIVKITDKASIVFRIASFRD